MVKILCIGDQHFTNNNVEEINVFLSELQKYLDEHDIDIIVSLGDLLHQHEKVNVLALKRASDYLQLLTKYCTTYVLVGNHDMINSSQFLSENHWLYPFKTLGVSTKYPLYIIDKPIMETIYDVKLVFCGYVPDGKFIDALNTINKWEDAHCVFGHQTINGAKFGPINVDNVESWESHYPLCVSGHIHIPQKIGDNKNYFHKGNWIYCGSIFNSIGDDSKKRLLLLDINNVCINLKDVHLNLLQKNVIKINYNEINEFDYTHYKNTKLKLIINFDGIDLWKTFKKSKKYNELINYGIKIDPNININIDEHVKSKSKNFIHILDELVNSTQNTNVINIYKNLLLNKSDIFDSDVIEL